MGNKKKSKKKASVKDGDVPATIESEIESNVLKVADLERRQKERRTTGERLSEAIAEFCGSMTFVYVHIIWFGGWILVNTAMGMQFDPFPFTFLTLVVSLEAIFLSTFILISQNHETMVSERRNHLDLQINMLAEQENTRMLELLHAIAQKVGVDHDPEQIRPLMEDMEPEKIFDHIEQATGGGDDDADDPNG